MAKPKLKLDDDLKRDLREGNISSERAMLQQFHRDHYDPEAGCAKIDHVKADVDELQRRPKKNGAADWIEFC